MRLSGIDHVEIYVSDLDETIHEFRDKYEFAVVATNTTRPDRRSVLLTRGSARLVLTAATGERGEVSDFVEAHGDGVRDIALRVDDAEAGFAAAVAGGALALAPVQTAAGVTTATIGGVESITHTLVQRGVAGDLLPGFRPVAAPARVPVDAAAVRAIDHLAICLPPGTLGRAEEFYGRTLGLRRSFTEYVEFGDQAMDSLVVEDPDRRVTFTLVAPDCERGQLVDFLAAFDGGGVQHLAFLTDRIVEAVPRLGARGVAFLGTPDSYYDALPGRLGYSPADARTLGELGILADRDPWGELLQIFVRSPFPRRTLFFELIERRNARTFGSANIRALYEAAEHERAAVGVGGRPA